MAAIIMFRIARLSVVTPSTLLSRLQPIQTFTTLQTVTLPSIRRLSQCRLTATHIILDIIHIIVTQRMYILVQVPMDIRPIDTCVQLH
jgi:hypothetical protein